MNIIKYLFPTLLIGGAAAGMLRWFSKLLASQAPAKRGSTKEYSTGIASHKEIDDYVSDQRLRLNIPGASLAIVEGEQIVHQRGFGRARPGGETPRPQTPFFIGSLTKSFTALAILQLVDAGAVELDAPLQRYLPWFRVADPQASTQMTVRHLLNQTSGLPTSLGLANLSDIDRHVDATERQARSLSTLKLTRPVGSKFEYSNLNYNLLGLIVEAASGERYADYIQKHIFDPLDMRHSYASKTLAQQDNLAVGHSYWFGYPVPVLDLSIPPGSLPSGQLISSAEDMSHYLIAYLNGGNYCGKQIVSEAGLTELLRGAVEWKEMGISVGRYGMGWVSVEFEGINIVSHSGDVPDFGAFMALVPEQKRGIVLLFNANHAMMKLTKDEVGLGTAQLLAGIPPSPQIFGFAPWLMRSTLLIPAIQIVGVLATLSLLRRLHLDPAHHPSRRRIWGQHILFNNIPNLLTALTLLPMLGKMRGFMQLFMPDFFWIAWICGSFAVVWTFLRTGLILQALRKYRRR